MIYNSWWRDNALVIEAELSIKPSELARRLIDLGYERAPNILGKGLFALRGGIIEIWPINTEKPYLIEFRGNVVEAIYERETIKNAIEARPQYYRGFASIERLPQGSYVVHVDHGIGIFRGIVSENCDSDRFASEIKNQKNPKFQILNSKFFLVEYAPPAPGRHPDLLYVPIDQKDRLSPYIGFTTPTVHRLGGTVWFKTKRKAKEDAEKFAKELLELYAKRHRVSRPPYPTDEMLERELRETFPFTETEDQIRAEKEIAKDLSLSKPMDRLLCGDVGFGKTEVAIRAALRVIASGRQVAVLSPTTVLASQHEKTFGERFNSLPVKVRMLSRLTPIRDRKNILKELAEGKIDCLIGTHRLLSEDVVFKNLGLVIIDEEQRFGVKQKELFKEMRSEIDILSLSATPIPRTLSLTLAKLRDISVIETPPPERLPIQTFTLPYSSRTIRKAIFYELFRGGQVYFLHNRIETIEHVKEKLYSSILRIYPDNRMKSVPPLHKIKIGVIHGRMSEKEIIRIMDQFRKGEIKILLATTIIENGLDISGANTLIVDDATRLGLAEAHQLRGRIGRSNVQAFAYFLYRPQHLTEKALERLEALKEYAELGAGYKIALRDLEIRGAGNILGKEQSGTINKVGLNLYCQMLSEAIEREK